MWIAVIAISIGGFLYFSTPQEDFFLNQTAQIGGGATNLKSTITPKSFLQNIILDDAALAQGIREVIPKIEARVTERSGGQKPEVVTQAKTALQKIKEASTANYALFENAWGLLNSNLVESQKAHKKASDGLIAIIKSFDAFNEKYAWVIGN